MPVMIIPKNWPKFKTKKDAQMRAKGIGMEDGEIVYVYDKMRHPMSKTYPARHREASLKSYHKTKTTNRPQGRPKKENDNGKTL